MHALCNQVRGEYNSLLDETETRSINSGSYIQAYAKFETTAKRFEHAFELLETMNEADYRRWIGLCQLYNNRALKRAAHAIYAKDSTPKILSIAISKLGNI